MNGQPAVANGPSLWDRCRPRGRSLSVKEWAKIIMSYSTGVVKGAILAPVVVPTLVLGVLVSNLIAVPMMIDHGFLTIRYNRLVGRNLKVLAGILLPVAVILYVALSVVAIVPASLAFALWYPGHITLEIKRQSAFRYAYMWGGWDTTLQTMANLLLRYYYSVTIGFKEHARVFRRKAWPQTYDVHPLNLSVAFLMLTAGTALHCALLVALLSVKMPFLMVRSFLNHVKARDLWFRSPVLTLAWVAGLFGTPMGPPLLLLGAVPYSTFYGITAAELTLTHWGALSPGLSAFASSLRDANVFTTRFILRQDVPWYVPSGARIHAGWLIAGLIPLLFGILVVPLLGGLLCILSAIPVLFGGLGQVGTGLEKGSVQAKPHLFLGLALLGLLAPALMPVGLLCVWLWACADTFTAIGVTHSKRSLVAGLQYQLGLVYRLEYALNKFALAVDEREQVHWASLLPRSFGFAAQPYMDSAEWDAGGGANLPYAIVSKPIRYVPAGMRRPRFDENGKAIDMTQAAYDVPGLGITRLGKDGQTLKAPATWHGSTSATTTFAARRAVLDEELAKGRSKQATGTLSYGPDMLPKAYVQVFSAMVVGGHMGGGLSKAHLEAQAAAKATGPVVVASNGDVTEGRPSDSESLPGPAGAPAHVAGEASDAGSPLPDEEDDASAHANRLAQQQESACCHCLTGNDEPPDGYEEHDAAPMPVNASGEVLITPHLVRTARREGRDKAARRASLDEVAGSAAADAIAAAAEESAPAGLTIRSVAAPTEVAEHSTVRPAVETAATAGSSATQDAGAGASLASESAGSTISSGSGSSGAVAVSETSVAPTVVVVVEPAARASATLPSPDRALPPTSLPADALSASYQSTKKTASSFASAMRNAAAARLASAAASSPTGDGGGSSGAQLLSPVAGPAIVVVDDEKHEEEEEDSDEESMFVLQPIVKPELPDEWVAVKDATGATYYANYARSQSSWRVPPGVRVASVALAARAAMSFIAKANASRRNLTASQA